MPPLLASAIKILPLSFSANGYLDSGSPLRAYVKVPSNVGSVVSCLVTLAFRQFMAPATAAASGGGSTSGSSSAASAGSSQDGVTLSGGGTNGTTGPASAGTAHTHLAGSIATNDNAIISLTGHVHTIAHTHTTPNHTHSLSYGTFEEAFPVSLSVKVKTYLRVGSAWVLQNTTASLTNDLQDVDLSAVITGPGDWRLEVLSDAATPNGGRLGLDLFGTLETHV